MKFFYFSFISMFITLTVSNLMTLLWLLCFGFLIFFLLASFVLWRCICQKKHFAIVKYFQTSYKEVASWVCGRTRRLSHSGNFCKQKNLLQHTKYKSSVTNCFCFAKKKNVYGNHRPVKQGMHIYMLRLPYMHIYTLN